MSESLFSLIVTVSMCHISVMQDNTHLDFGQMEVVEAIDGEGNNKDLQQPQEEGMTFIVEVLSMILIYE